MNPSTHSEIARRAHSLWRERGCPTNCDDTIWFEAERQINRGPPPNIDQGPQSFGERVKTETAAESVVEYQITPAGTEQEAIQAAIQTSTPRSGTITNS